MFRSLWLAGIVLAAAGGTGVAAPCPSGSTASAPIVPPPVLNLNGETCELSGVHTYTSITLVNSTINVNPYTGGSKSETGNLELRSLTTISIDEASTISAKGAGYQTPLCGNGEARTPTGGGRGGCSLMDSGGGGAHFGIGGRGTRDNPSGNNFYENDCSAPVADGGSGITVSYDGSGVATCSPTTQCRNSDAVPTVAGQPYFHSIYDPDFGGSGGDKGCLDGDGRDPTSSPMNYGNFAYGIVVGGGGGGRIVLAAVNAARTGQITINGQLNANGKRGCGSGNDSGGGGAGGTIFVAGDNVTIGATAIVTAAGGLGGDTEGLDSDPTGECVEPAQQDFEADDCGGGGGGGIVSVLSGTSASINDRAVFNVNGGLGGVSDNCRGEAGGGVGELQISGGYVGELCDGFDNDFNDMVDDLPALDCGGTSMMSCVAGVPQECAPDLMTCRTPVTDTRTRFAVIVDTSGSMLGDLGGTPTFGDGSLDRPGLDQDSDANDLPDDSRLFKAKRALVNVISAYPSIDFALARYHQDQSVNRSCQEAHNFECNAICCTYDNPTNNTNDGLPACSTEGAGGATVQVYKESPGNTECINYAGSCGPPRRGADILAGFGSDINNYLMWLDGTETNFINTTDRGAYCDFAAGGNCELRGTGPTPLANSLNAVEDYLTPIKACDIASPTCRKYNVILLTDGAESCQGDPVAAAAALLAKGINTYVVGFSTKPEEAAQLDAIAAAGGTGTAFSATSEEQLANALAQIVSGSIVFETCNNMDDDCDGAIDEDFPQKGDACDDGLIGKCRGTGELACITPSGSGLFCDITDPGDAPTMEVCNGIDDNCNGAVDEGLDCNGCVPQPGPDLCDGVDSNCNGADGEGDPQVGLDCGVSDVPPCMLGEQRCIGGAIQCVGNRDPQTEICNGLDDNCDGMGDLTAACPGATSCVDGGCRVPCAPGEFACPAGFRCDTVSGGYCVPSACASCAPNEICQNDACVDPCAGVTCDALEECRFGTCVDCNVFGCQPGLVCVESMCVADPCDGVDCSGDCTNPAGCSCRNGACINNCDDTLCPTGQRCNADGVCMVDACAGIECDDGEACVDGACVIDVCRDITCRIGDRCVDGECIDDPCKLVDCTGAFHCEVRDGAAVCAPDNPAGRQVLVQAGGGGGCSSSGGGGGGAAVLLLALGIVVRRRRARIGLGSIGALLALVAVGSLAVGCDLNPYDLSRRNAGDGGPGGDGGMGDGGGGDDGGAGDDGGPTSCTPIGVDDQCNEIDDDCDGVVDQAFDKQTNANHCGVCNNRCVGAGAIQKCELGQCVIDSCQPGFADLDGNPLDCEYRCPQFPTIAEDCNGIDDDCDGIVDNNLPPPPTDECRDLPDTPCEGVTMVCDTRNAITQWYCDYAPEVEFDPDVPDGIVLQETLCDGFDGDCDGVIDDAFPDKGDECDNGLFGVCRDVGVRVCDTAMPTQTRCDLSVLPDAGTMQPEVCNGLDDNCDNIIDNGATDSMTRVTFGGLDFFIDTYEASHPDATATSTGVSTLRSCSNPGVLPWRGATHAAAAAACAAAGKTLCTPARWEAACEQRAAGEPSDRLWPYGNAFAPQSCNTETYDGDAGTIGDQDLLIATGALPSCSSASGVMDLSGNLREWTTETVVSGGITLGVQRGGSYLSPEAATTCAFRLTRAAVTSIEPDTGFRCCRNP